MIPDAAMFPCTIRTFEFTALLKAAQMRNFLPAGIVKKRASSDVIFIHLISHHLT